LDINRHILKGYRSTDPVIGVSNDAVHLPRHPRPRRRRPLWCRTGERIRIAGIQAPDFETAAPCRRPARQRRAFRCDDRAAARSQRLVSALVLNKRIRCQPVDLSYNRIVARCTLPDGRSLSCAAIAAGAAVRWGRYWRQSGMGMCL